MNSDLAPYCMSDFRQSHSASLSLVIDITLILSFIQPIFAQGLTTFQADVYTAANTKMQFSAFGILLLVENINICLMG